MSVSSTNIDQMLKMCYAMSKVKELLLTHLVLLTTNSKGTIWDELTCFHNFLYTLNYSQTYHLQQSCEDNFFFWN